MINWHLEKRKIKDLRDHPKNPRSLTKDQAFHLKASLDKYGLIDKPIINQDGLIIGGHQRKRILKETGVKEIECWVPDRTLSESEIDELCIRLNKNTGEWDYDILANHWEMSDLIQWGFTANDFPDLDIEQIINEDEEENDTLSPKEDKDAFTELGDLYELNNHRIVCGDSTLHGYVNLVLNEQVPILMVTDPPYGVEYDANWRSESIKDGGKRAKGKVQNDDKVNWSLAWHLFPGSVAYVWHAGKYCSEVENSLTQCEYEIISQIIWVKQHFALSRGDYHWQHEPCWYAIKKGHSHNWQGARDQSTAWDIASLGNWATLNKKELENERTSHSTQKPIECMARPIRNNTAEGEGVYDPFIGSGTTLIAAEQLKRTCYGIELSPAYCDIIVDRWIKYMIKSGKEYTIKRNGEVISWTNK